MNSWAIICLVPVVAIIGGIVGLFWWMHTTVP
jgi:hypothetical protein